MRDPSLFYSVFQTSGHPIFTKYRHPSTIFHSNLTLGMKIAREKCRRIGLYRHVYTCPVRRLFLVQIKIEMILSKSSEHYHNKSTMEDVKMYFELGTDVVKYYKYRGVVYVGQFPVEWALDHLPNTGPNKCGNCSFFGSIYYCGRIDGKMFLGYCANCAKDYGGKRGRGLVGGGEEVAGEEVTGEEFTEMMEYPSIYDTYMKGVDVNRMDTTEVSLTMTTEESEMWYGEDGEEAESQVWGQE